MASSGVVNVNVLSRSSNSPSRWWPSSNEVSGGGEGDGEEDVRVRISSRRILRSIS